MGTALWVLFVSGFAAPGGAQELVLKRTLPEGDGAVCPALPAPTEPTAEARSRASRLRAEGNQAALLGEHAAARDLYRQVAQLDPADADVAYRLARTYEELEQPEAAAEQYCRYLRLAPDAPDAREVRARVGDLRTPTSSVPQQAIEDFRAGITHFEEGRLGSAQRSFTQAIRRSPAWPDLYFNRALVREAQAEPREALQDYRQYLSLQPAAADTAAVRERVAAIRSVIPRVTPSGALIRGAIVPGLGQFSTGRPLLGSLVVAGAGTAVLVGLQEETVRDTILREDPFGNLYPDEILRTHRPDLGTGIALAAGIGVLGAVEAYFHSRREEARRKLPSSGSGGAQVGWKPFVAPGRSGEARLGVHFGLSRH